MTLRIGQMAMIAQGLKESGSRVSVRSCSGLGGTNLVTLAADHAPPLTQPLPRKSEGCTWRIAAAVNDGNGVHVHVIASKDGPNGPRSHSGSTAMWLQGFGSIVERLETDWCNWGRRSTEGMPP